MALKSYIILYSDDITTASRTLYAATSIIRPNLLALTAPLSPSSVKRWIEELMLLVVWPFDDGLLRTIFECHSAQSVLPTSISFFLYPVSNFCDVCLSREYTIKDFHNLLLRGLENCFYLLAPSRHISYVCRSFHIATHLHQGDGLLTGPKTQLFHSFFLHLAIPNTQLFVSGPLFCSILNNQLSKARLNLWKVCPYYRKQTLFIYHPSWWL